MIEVRYKGRLGNNLLQYALGRRLAEELGFALVAEPIPGFPNTAQRVAGARHEAPEQVIGGQRFELHAVTDDRSPRRIVLDGWFNRREYFMPWRDRIREWLRLDPSVVAGAPPGATVVHVRRLDYVQLGWALPFSYYAEAIERCAGAGDPLWIATDDPRDPFFWRFRRWRVRFCRGSSLGQLAAMTQASRLILSQSTYSWWAAFLGNALQVLAPLPQYGIWAASAPEGTSLLDPGWFDCLPCRESYVPTRAEALYQALRLQRRRMTLGLNRRLGLSLAVPPP